jgi:hypothetical protein
LPIAFLRVEPIYLRVLQANPGISPEEVEPLGFGATLRAIEELSQTNPVICLESTGTAGYFGEFLRALQAAYQVYLIRIVAPADLCISRVLRRDKADHIPVSDDRLRHINQVAAKVALKWDLEFDNSREGNEGAIVSAVAALLEQANH